MMTRPIGARVRCVLPWPRAAACGLLAASVVLAACGDTETRSQPTSPDLAPSAAVSGANPLVDYTLTVRNVTALRLAHHALYRLSRRDPAPLERLAEVVEELHPEEFEQAVAAIAGEPVVRRTIEQAGLTPRDFYLTQHNLVSADFVLRARAAGRSDHLPEVSEQNVAFVHHNASLVGRVMTERRPRDP